MNQAVKLQLLGQSVWYDNIRRSLIEDGTLLDRIERREILGVTSNPSIFSKAIAESDDYDADLQTMSWAGLDAKQIFYHLAIKDIQDTADLLRPYYDATGGADGFVCLEVSPDLAYDTEGTIEEAFWLWEQVNRPNLMVKIPGTVEGLPAITEAIAAGINVNVTLIFSNARYQQVMEAYTAGLERRLAAGLDLSGVAAVASFFVSRLESKVDKRLQTLIEQGGNPAQKAVVLKGRLAVDNIRLAYQTYEKFFNSPRFAKLAAAGAQKQRPLWASTGTKDPAYSDVKYVESLVAPNSINTLPPKTLDAFLDHGGDPALTIFDELEQAEKDFALLAELGISMEEITQELEDEGVDQFNQAFSKLLEVIEARRQTYVGSLGDLAENVASAAQRYADEEIIPRMHRFDPTVWTNTPAGKTEAQTRLGWLALPEESQHLIAGLYSFADQAIEDGFTKVLLLGMGGSSLAPETLSLIFGDYVGGPELKILDSTLPEQVAAAEAWADLDETLFVVSSKSGSTTEPMSFFHYFWAKAEAVLGKQCGEHFVAITDPGSQLAALGAERGFRAVFTANPNVGGRYSALTHFGLVPAALMGLEVEQALWSAAAMAHRCSPAMDLVNNPGAVLGIILGSAAAAGRDKLTLVADNAVQPLGPWLEQLVAESSGKEGKGIVPVADEPLMAAENYGADRLFAYLRATGEYDDFMVELREAGQPVLVLDIPYLYDVAGEFYRWEYAIAVACSVIGVNAFDQPDVQDNKDRTKAKIKAYLEAGELSEPDVIWEADGVQVYGQPFVGLAECHSVSDVIEAFTAQAVAGDYVAINAYLPRNDAVEAKLTALRDEILETTGRATTLGFGPRFLHSTGQLHKGGANNGLFLQITQEDRADLDIPGNGYSFGVLARAQAQGDLEALLSRGRRAIRIHLPAGDPLTF